MAETPDGLPRVTVEMRDGRPTVLWDGQPYVYMAYFLRKPVDRDEDGKVSRIDDREEYVRRLTELCRPFGERGIHGYEVPTNIGWNGPDDWDVVNPTDRGCAPIDDQLRSVVGADPEARMMIEFVIHAPDAWKEAYPDEMELDDRGMRYQASIGSNRYIDELCANLPRVVQHVESGPYARNVLNYFFSCYNEGFTESCLRNAVTDFSPAMHRALRVWLREKYNGDEAALREAWREPDVTFQNAAVPTRDEQMTTHAGWFRDPLRSRKVLDYIQCRVDRYVDMHYRIARTVKEACAYRVPVYCFGVYLQVSGWPGCYWSPESGMADYQYNTHALSVQTGWKRIIECPDIDGWESPYDYYYRQMGGVVLNQSIEESMHLRGKLFQINEDTRTFLSFPSDVYGRVSTREETTAVHRRNFGAIASQWEGGNWMEQLSNWLHDEEVLDQLGEFNRLLQCSIQWPETPVDAIGVFIDEISLRYERPLMDLDWDLIYKQRVFGLSHCGVPFRVHLLDDLELHNMPDYKCNILLNAFYMTPEREAMVREKLCRDGKTLVWMIAPGFCHSTEGLSTDSMQRLTGIRFTKEDVTWEQWITLCNFTHPITQGLAHDLTYGSNVRIGPSFIVDDPDVTVLGRKLMYRGRHEPALVVKEFDTHRSMYSGAPLLPADLLRNIARYAGSHVYTDSNDVVIVGRGLLTYHTVAPGPRTVRLPQPATVHDLFTGECLATDADELTLTFDQPGTQVLTTLPPELWRA